MLGNQLIIFENRLLKDKIKYFFFKFPVPTVLQHNQIADKGKFLRIFVLMKKRY